MIVLDPDKELALLKEAHRAYQRSDIGGMLSATDEILRDNPKCDEAIFIAAVAHMRTDNDGLALQLLNVCAQLKPDVHAIWHNIARCLSDRHPVDAYKAAAKANTIQPDDKDTLINLCNLSSQLGRHAESIDWWKRCLSIHGFDQNGAVNASFAHLHLGQWAEAWKLYRGSMGSTSRPVRNYHNDRETPRWRPDKHEDAVVVLYGEQGIGDEIMFASMVPRALETGARIIIECTTRNEELFRRSFPSATVYGTRSEKYVEWPADEGVTHKLEFGGLGEYFGREPFRANSYLKADPIRREMFSVWLRHEGFHTRPKIGIAWTGGSWQTGRGRRSIPFRLIAAFIEAFPEVDFVNLEYEDRRDELKMLRSRVLNPHWATRKGADYDDLAALVSELDLVIAPTTSVVDLCGALGVECWALVDENPQWRYSEFAGHDRMFFYESVRVIRQQEWGRWETVIQIAEQDLRERLAKREAGVNGAQIELYADAVAACKEELIFWYERVGERAYNLVVMTDPGGASIKAAAWAQVMRERSNGGAS